MLLNTCCSVIQPLIALFVTILSPKTDEVFHHVPYIMVMIQKCIPYILYQVINIATDDLLCLDVVHILQYPAEI